MNFLCFRGNRLNIQTVPTDEATRKFVHEYWRYFKSKVQSSSSKYSQVSFLTRITFNVSVKFDGFFVTARERKSLSMCQLERFSIAFTANGRLKFPFYQKLVKIIWFQLVFCLLATAMEQVLKTEK